MYLLKISVKTSATIYHQAQNNPQRDFSFSCKYKKPSHSFTISNAVQLERVKEDMQSGKILILGVLLCSGALLTFALLPTLPVHSREVTAAYFLYRSSPSEETRRAYEEAIDRMNRPFHILQYISGTCGLVLPLVLIFHPWRKRRASGHSPVRD